MQQNKKIVWPNVMAPVAAIYPHVRKIHDDTVQDDYYWMIDYFKKGEKSQEVIDYLEEENNYTNLMLQDTEDLQENLFDELKSRIKEKDESVPYYKNGYYYYSRTEEGKQYFKFCRKKGTLEGEEEVLLVRIIVCLPLVWILSLGENIPYLSKISRPEKSIRTR